MFTKAFLYLLVTALVLPRFLHAEDDMKPYPPAAEGYVRQVVQLPVLDEKEEQDRKVEILISKIEKLDLANLYFYGGKIATKTAKGWGYPYYEVTQVGPMAGTLMAIPEFAPKVDRAVPLRGGLELVRYNSKLPIVVYVPVGFDVTVRVWAAGDEIEAVEE